MFFLTIPSKTEKKTWGNHPDQWGRENQRSSTSMETKEGEPKEKEGRSELKGDKDHLPAFGKVKKRSRKGGKNAPLKRETRGKSLSVFSWRRGRVGKRGGGPVDKFETHSNRTNREKRDAQFHRKNGSPMGSPRETIAFIKGRKGLRKKKKKINQVNWEKRSFPTWRTERDQGGKPGFSRPRSITRVGCSYAFLEGKREKEGSDSRKRQND